MQAPTISHGVQCQSGLQSKLSIPATRASGHQPKTPRIMLAVVGVRGTLACLPAGCSICKPTGRPPRASFPLACPCTYRECAHRNFATGILVYSHLCERSAAQASEAGHGLILTPKNTCKVTLPPSGSRHHVVAQDLEPQGRDHEPHSCAVHDHQCCQGTARRYEDKPGA